ncbi:MAG: 50S ribosomal protein L32 [Candidatus Nomurabacteria bacterium GW2011_GWA1_46_11]|uniref:Large ribosomal subunit protein bL32 n=3 Tax=Parcubacteria group TaxID=1794811 RepID=A0A1F8G190_9BACT|nr:MAG: 50S ribosomal protein L32 [Candidatus Nomurabacteria bacterium GW2011_GWA1_46_11]OGN19107.1 MAG: 50S ribosomal protein L32 [Candidatus Yanofskybacteria bacterium RIFCSPHIGHO2_12_FULL_45_19b]OGN31453.1 MAG: 50S ribosomal protein L32 [Candidatus Yanofskybacteria bacterium RIFCSPLOWO2_02_FULL_45_10]
MGVPRAHSTRGQKGRRRSHLALKPANFSTCSNCHKQKLSHRACPHCGYYNGRAVVNVLAKELRKKEKQRKKRS